MTRIPHRTDGNFGSRNAQENYPGGFNQNLSRKLEFSKEENHRERTGGRACLQKEKLGPSPASRKKRGTGADAAPMKWKVI